MKDLNRRLCVFCGSARGVDPAYSEAALTMGRLLSERGVGLVYGGGGIGLMTDIADAVLLGGGDVTGVIPEHLDDREVGHKALTKLHVVRSMHERKALMCDLSDGFCALPGGFGTFDELFEIVTWAQLEIHRKPVGILNVNGYFDPLLALIDHAVEEGFVRPEYRALIQEASEPAELLDNLADTWEMN